MDAVRVVAPNINLHKLFTLHCNFICVLSVVIIKTDDDDDDDDDNAGCKNSIRHIENRFSPYFIILFLMQFRL